MSKYTDVLHMEALAIGFAVRVAIALNSGKLKHQEIPFIAVEHEPACSIHQIGEDLGCSCKRLLVFLTPQSRVVLHPDDQVTRATVIGPGNV